MRGYQKRVVHLKKPDSPLFEEAYFVIREGIAGKNDERDMISEAGRIIEENSGLCKKENRAPKILWNMLVFGVGFFSSFFCFLMIYLIL